MALTIAMVAKNPFALERAKEAFLGEHKEHARPWGHGTCCQIVMEDGDVIQLLSEADWRRGAYCRECFDQIFRVGPEPLGIDFMLELQECLKVSCVPEEWQWQKWEPERADE